MRNRLFLICPTDGLETIINRRCKQKSFFFTSLGNSFISDEKTLAEFKAFIQEKEIDEICFVISEDNQIVVDALGEQSYAKIDGMTAFYKELNQQKGQSKVGLKSEKMFTVLSYYLNKKIKELRAEIESSLVEPIHITGKIYSREKRQFLPIYSDLICIEKHQLN